MSLAVSKVAQLFPQPLVTVQLLQVVAVGLLLSLSCRRTSKVLVVSRSSSVDAAARGARVPNFGT